MPNGRYIKNLWQAKQSARMGKQLRLMRLLLVSFARPTGLNGMVMAP